MKIFLISSVFAVVMAVVAYYVLINTGMDSATVYSSGNVRL